MSFDEILISQLSFFSFINIHVCMRQSVFRAFGLLLLFCFVLFCFCVFWWMPPPPSPHQPPLFDISHDLGNRIYLCTHIHYIPHAKDSIPHTRYIRSIHMYLVCKYLYNLKTAALGSRIFVETHLVWGRGFRRNSALSSKLIFASGV